jgi:hypothetical protein
VIINKREADAKGCADEKMIRTFRDSFFKRFINNFSCCITLAQSGKVVFPRPAERVTRLDLDGKSARSIHQVCVCGFYEFLHIPKHLNLICKYLRTLRVL